MNNGLFSRKISAVVLVLGFLFLIPSTAALADFPLLKKLTRKLKSKQQDDHQEAAHRPFRDSPWGDYTHYGTQDDPAQGYRHYDNRARRYGQWYQPKLFGLTSVERCAPPLFRPRGYGNLFNRSSVCYRMDYRRYVLTDHHTDYGPSYYHNQPDPKCKTTDKGRRNDQ